MTKEHEIFVFFEKTHQNTILDIILGHIIEDSGVNQTELKLRTERKEMWCLFLVGEKALHLYDHATKNSTTSVEYLPAEPFVFTNRYIYLVVQPS